MSLLQWFLPRERGALLSVLTPRETRSLTFPEGGGEWRRGAILESPDLLLPMAIGRPAHEPPGEGVPLRWLELRFGLVADGAEGNVPLVGAQEDAVGTLSLLTEYCLAIARLIDASELVLHSLRPDSKATLSMRLGPLEGWGSRRAGWSLLLLLAGADVLARARGLCVVAGEARGDGGAWYPVDAALPRVLAPADVP
ncbi:MAG: hypothetical protein ACO3JL_05320 [Myxococcota bacterium]